MHTKSLNTRRTTRFPFPMILAALSTLFLAGSGPGVRAQEADEASTAERIARGRISYRLYCRSCHGEHAKGGGPVAEMLKVAPADLTKISARHGGEFPEEKILRMIDGRDAAKGHGNRDMPIWGEAFQVVEESEDEAMIQEKITRLVYYLRSIQEEDSE